MNLARIKQHLRIDHADEDDYISELEKAARVFVARDLNRNVYDDASTTPVDDTFGIVLTPDLEQAMLLLIGHWYEHREAATDTAKAEVPIAYWRLVQHYRLYGV